MVTLLKILDHRINPSGFYEFQIQVRHESDAMIQNLWFARHLVTNETMIIDYLLNFTCAQSKRILLVERNNEAFHRQFAELSTQIGVITAELDLYRRKFRRIERRSNSSSRSTSRSTSSVSDNPVASTKPGPHTPEYEYPYGDFEPDHVEVQATVISTSEKSVTDTEIRLSTENVVESASTSVNEKGKKAVANAKTDSDRPFPCNQCSKSYLSRSNLNRHLLVHGEKSFACPYSCGKSFSNKFYSTEHGRRCSKNANIVLKKKTKLE